MAAKEIALLEMQLAATMAALHTFMDHNKKLLPQDREPPPMSEYFGSQKRPFDDHPAIPGISRPATESIYKDAQEALCNATKENFAEVAQAIINPMARARVESNLVPSEVVNQAIDEEDSDSVLSAREKEEEDDLFERIVASSHKQQAVAEMIKLPGSIRWYKFEATVAFRDEDWHSDIGAHLEENVQEYLDQYMENGGVVTKATFSKTGEFGSTP